MVRKERQKAYLIIYDDTLEYDEALDQDIMLPFDVVITKLSFYFATTTVFSTNTVALAHLTKAILDTIDNQDPLDFYDAVRGTNDTIKLQYYPDQLIEMFPVNTAADSETLYEVNCHYPILSGTTLRSRLNFDGLTANLTTGIVDLIIEAQIELYPYEVTP